MNSEQENRGRTSLAGPDGVEGVGMLLRLAALADELPARHLADEARDLAARVSEGRFYLACLGQFKRGKSTLINALVGDPVLPAGVVPVTAVPTVVRYGTQKQARIQFRDGAWQPIAVQDLKLYVCEEYNSENAKGVGGAEVFVPSPLLATGMCIVDTPGLGSVFTGNTAATQAFIPHLDAALVVVGADPPLAGEELATVEAVGRRVEKLILVLNKADRTSEAERAAAAEFTRKVLETSLHRTAGAIYEVSATERLESRGPERDWGKLLSALEALVEDSGHGLVQSACDRGVQRLSEQLLAIVIEEREALERPLEESERRIAALSATIAGADRSIREVDYLWMAEQRRLSDLFLGRHKDFMRTTLPQAQAEFEQAMRNTPRAPGPAYRRAIMRAAQEIAQRHVLPWLRSEQNAGEAEYRLVARRFVEMANDFLKKLAESEMRELARMPSTLDPSAGFRTRSRFQFRDMIEIAQPASPLRWMADWAAGLVGARGMIERDGREFLERLVEVNCSRVQNDVLKRVEESRGRLEAEIRKLLHEVNRIAFEALAHARQTQAAGASAVDASRSRLDRVEEEIMGISLRGRAS